MRALPHARYRGSAAKVGVLHLWGLVRYMGVVVQACFGAVFVASPKRRLRSPAGAFLAAAACSRAYASRIAAPHAAASGIAASLRAS